MNLFTRILRDRRGASAAEYAMILAIVGTAIAVAAFSLSQAVSNAIDNATEAIETCGGTC